MDLIEIAKREERRGPDPLRTLVGVGIGGAVGSAAGRFAGAARVSSKLSPKQKAKIMSGKKKLTPKDIRPMATGSLAGLGAGALAGGALGASS